MTATLNSGRMFWIVLLCLLGRLMFGKRLITFYFSRKGQVDIIHVKKFFEIIWPLAKKQFLKVEEGKGLLLYF